MTLDDSAAIIRVVAHPVARFYNPVRLHSTLGNVIPGSRRLLGRFARGTSGPRGSPMSCS
jgi:hypothetical protein